MTHTRPVIVCCMVILGAVFGTCAGGCDKHAEDRAAVNEVFRDWSACNEDHNGAAVVQFISEASFPRYERILKAVLEARREDVQKLPALDMYEVLSIRARAKRSELKGLNGRQFCELATTKGWYDSDEAWGGQVEWETRWIRFEDNSATGLLFEDGEATDVQVKFVREGGAWKLEEHLLLESLNESLEYGLAEQGIPKSANAIEWVALDLGAPPPDSVWNPLR